MFLLLRTTKKNLEVWAVDWTGLTNLRLANDLVIFTNSILHIMVMFNTLQMESARVGVMVSERD